MACAPKDPGAIAHLRRMLRYCAKTGKIFWREKPSKRVLAGATAGFPTATGHLRIEVGGHRYWAHHIAWLFTYGEWPPMGVDHRNGRPDDNRIENLRLATVSQNSQNSKLKATSLSGLKGVGFCRQTGKWRAAITKDGKYHSLGRYEDRQSAHAAYLAAASRLFGEFARAA